MRVVPLVWKPPAVVLIFPDAVMLVAPPIAPALVIPPPARSSEVALIDVAPAIAPAFVIPPDARLRDDSVPAPALEMRVVPFVWKPPAVVLKLPLPVIDAAPVIAPAVERLNAFEAS